MKNKKHVCAAVAVFAALVVSVFAAHSYIGVESLYQAESGILTPASDEIDGVVIPEMEIPLSQGSEVSVTPVATSEHPYIQQVVDLVNAERANAGLAPLTVSAELNKAAAVRAEEIYTLFSHDRPNGERYYTVLIENGIVFSGCGENVAYGFITPAEVMGGWMESEGHKQNILRPEFTNIGIGYYVGPDGYEYWSQLFTH